MDQSQLLIIAVTSGIISFLVVRKMFGADPTKLVEYKSPKGKFIALLPPGTQEKTQKVNTPEGKIRLYITLANGKFHQFIVSYCDYPQHVIDANFAEKMLDGSRDGAVRNVHGELLSETVFDFHGFEAREIHMKVNTKVTSRMRIVLVNRRLYQLQVISAPENIFSKKVGAFFEGFSVTEIS